MGAIIEIVFILVYLVIFLFILIIPVIYLVGYIQDALFGDWLLKHVLLILNKISKPEKRNILNKLDDYLNSENAYVKYETPLCTYCFSFSALLIVMEFFNGLETIYAYIIATLIYVTVYFIGMYHRRRSDTHYNEILKNNRDFLKLSFIPLAFLITVGGFLFTITGYRIQEIDLNYFSMIIQIFTEHDISKGVIGDILYYCKSGIFILLAMYVFSVPMQLISYYILEVIFYLGEHKGAYKRMLQNYKKIILSIKR